MRRSLSRAIYYGSLLLIVITLFTACVKKEADHEHDTYTCSMHPMVVSDRPGTCPICGMELVRKTRAGEEITVSDDVRKLTKSPNEAVVASVKTIKGEYRSMQLRSEAQGVVTYDTRKVYTLSSRFGGRLEKVYVKYAFQPVRKGQKVAEIYSPELVTAQRELLYIVKNDPGNETMIDAAKNKLLSLGVSTGQLNAILKQQTAQYSFTVFSPYDGYVVAEGQQAPSTTTAMASPAGEMSEQAEPAKTTAPLSEGNTPGITLREGDYVSAGQTLFTIVNAEAFRIELDLPQAQAGALQSGGTVVIHTGSDSIRTTVDFVQPFLTTGEEFLKVRVYIPHGKDLKIGQLVKARVDLGNQESLWIPTEAVVDLGMEQVVFIKRDGIFKPGKVVTGAKTDGWIEVKHGLSTADEIAGNAQFLVDSESFIKTTK